MRPVNDTMPQRIFLVCQLLGNIAGVADRAVVGGASEELAGSIARRAQ